MPDAEARTYRRIKRLWIGAVVWTALVIGAFLFFLLHEAAKRDADRIVSRYVLCRELENTKRAQRIDLTAKINESRAFLRANPQGIPNVPALSAALIRRGISRNEMLRASLAPYPRGCAAFARDPSDLHVTVPRVKEKP